MLIHRYWSGETEPPLEPWLGNVLFALNPGVTIHDWTDDTLPREIHDDAYAMASQVRDIDRIHHASNIIRLRLLYDFGGWWYDHDVIPFLPVTSLPKPVAASHGGLCNSFLGFAQGDNRLANALSKLYQKPTSNMPSTAVSGSLFLRPLLPDIHLLEYPYSPVGTLLHHDRPFAVHLSMSHGTVTS